MQRLIYLLLVFTTLAALGLMVYIAKHKVEHGATLDLQIPELDQGLITEITMEVYNDWCGGPTCPDYRTIFRREGREPYYSSVTRIATRTGKTIRGDLSNYEFEQLAQLLQSQGFFKLQDVYPENSGCADCVIVKVTAVRDADRKKVTHLFGDIPLQLWTIQKAIEGTTNDVQWLDRKD